MAAPQARAAVREPRCPARGRVLPRGCNCSGSRWTGALLHERTDWEMHSWAACSSGCAATPTVLGRRGLLYIETGGFDDQLRTSEDWDIGSGWPHASHRSLSGIPSLWCSAPRCLSDTRLRFSSAVHSGSSSACSRGKGLIRVPHIARLRPRVYAWHLADSRSPTLSGVGSATSYDLGCGAFGPIQWVSATRVPGVLRRRDLVRDTCCARTQAQPYR